jgi:alpha-beta hydrolase superfamily lysophospholipase
MSKHTRLAVTMALAWLALLAGTLATMLFLVPTRAPSTMPSVVYHTVIGPLTPPPPLQKYRARDGTFLAFRTCTPSNPTTAVKAVLIHGSSGSSGDMTGLCFALAGTGVEAYALDIRGQGNSGRSGDIDYIGQQEDDLEDFLHSRQAIDANTRMVLVGFSSGGGFALRLAGDPQGRAFKRVVLLAPYLGPNAPSTRPDSGGWAKVNTARLAAIRVLHGLGIHAFDGLTIVGFAVPPAAARYLTPTWSYRMTMSFGASGNFRDDIRRVHIPVTVIDGDKDEIMFPEAYAPTLHAINPKVEVHILPGLGHMDLITDPTAIGLTVERTRQAIE